MNTQITFTERVTESDLLQLISPNTNDNINIKEKYVPCDIQSATEKKTKIMNILQTNYWNDVCSIISHLKERRQKLRHIIDGIDFLAYAISRIPAPVYDYLGELYIVSRDLAIAESRSTLLHDYVELNYEE